MTDSLSKRAVDGIYLYPPSLALAVVFAVLVFISLLLHVYQNFRYKYWRVMFFIVWAGLVFTAGWIVRAISTRHPDNANLYTAQYVLIYAGPPIYSAVEYNVLGRLMLYLPMHAPLHPGRVLIVFIYIGAAVESLTAAGAVMMASRPIVLSTYHMAGVLLSASLVLQGAVEALFMSTVALVHYRTSRSGMLSRRITKLCIMLYGTSALILFRCIFRAINSFSLYSVPCDGLCRFTEREWYLYVFEAVPMVLYTYWLNLVNPGSLLPTDKHIFLDTDGKTMRCGPGWVDRRPKWETFLDPLDIGGQLKKEPSHDKFWERPYEWPAVNIGGAGYSKEPQQAPDVTHSHV